MYFKHYMSAALLILSAACCQTYAAEENTEQLQRPADKKISAREAFAFTSHFDHGSDLKLPRKIATHEYNGEDHGYTRAQFLYTMIRDLCTNRNPGVAANNCTCYMLFKALDDLHNENLHEAFQEPKKVTNDKK